MKRRSSGSTDDDAGPSPVATDAPVTLDSITSNGGYLSPRSDEHSYQQKQQPEPRVSNGSLRPPSHRVSQELATTLDRRRSIDTRPSSARSRRPASINWKPNNDRDGTADSKTGLQHAAIADGAEDDTASSTTSSTVAALEKMGRVPITPRAANRSPWSLGLYTLVASIMGIGILCAIFNSLVTRPCDVKGCRMSYMRPSYAKLHDFDTEHTRFASKYSLYLYREQTVDDETRVGESTSELAVAAARFHGQANA